MGCCKRIVKARIKKVYVGTSDPFPSVDGKGIKYLADHGIEVEQYPQELQKEIESLNAKFINYAENKRTEEKNKLTKDYKEKTEFVVSTSNMRSLDEKLITKFLESANVSNNNREEFLREMTLIENDNGTDKPTGLGLLLFGKKPQSIYPNAVIKTKLTRNGNLIEAKTIEGNIPTQLNEVNAWYKNCMPSHISRDEAIRTKVFDYPLDVIRELICNAVVHRDYGLTGAPVYFEINERCIVIKSPGLPEPPLSLEHIMSFTASSFSRNPVIMYVLDKLNYVEQRGMGFETIRKLPKKNIPLPTVTYKDPYIEFTLPLNMDEAEMIYGDLSEKEIRTLEYIRMEGPVSISDIQKQFKIEQKPAYRLITKLKEKKYIVAIGNARNTVYKVAVSGQESGQEV